MTRRMSLPVARPKKPRSSRPAGPRARRALRGLGSRRVSHRGGVAALFGVWLATSGVTAQVPSYQQGRLLELGYRLASVEDSAAVRLNPANLAFLPKGELRYTGSFLRDSSASHLAGHAFSLGVPLGAKLATGVRLDFVQPPEGARRGAAGLDSAYRWWTWAAAAKLSNSTSLGASVQRSSGEGPIGEGLTSYSLAASLRPWDELGFSIIAQDLGEPSNIVGTRQRSLVGALAYRPTGTQRWEVGLESEHIADGSGWIPRASVAAEIPGFGQIRAAFQMVDPLQAEQRLWSATLGVAMNLDTAGTSAQVSTTGLVGDAVNASVGTDFQVSVAMRGFRQGAGLETGRSSAKIRLNSTPGPRGHVRLLRHLWSLGEQDSLDAVLLELRASPAATFAHLQELQASLAEVQASGKKLVCYLHDASLVGLALCGAADKVLIHPAASVHFTGLVNRYVYIGRLLEQLGIEAEVVAVGEHKSAPETFTRAGPSEVAHEDKEDLLEQQDRLLMAALARGRGVPVDQLKRTFARGPFVAAEAKSEGLVDEVAFADEVQKAVNEVVGAESKLRDGGLRASAKERFGSRPAIAMIYLEGEMVDGDSNPNPLFGSQSAGSYTIARALEKARQNPRVKAILLRVETPGGSAVAADVIWREVVLAAKEKPVVVSMGGYAASGGYYVAAAGTHIFANPLTVTGSIGVFVVKPNLSALLGRLGVDVAVYKTQPSADAEAPYRGLSEQERVALQGHVQKTYDRFLHRVAEGRKLTPQAVDAVARGRVWTGEQAKQHGLVDALGGLKQALDHARSLANLPDDALIWEYPKIRENLVAAALNVPGVSAAANWFPQSQPSAWEQLVRRHPVLNQLIDWAQPVVAHPMRQPLTRLQWVPSNSP